MVVVSIAALLLGGIALGIALIRPQRPELASALPDEPAVKPASRAQDEAPAIAPQPTAPAPQPRAPAEPTAAAGQASPDSPTAAPASGAVQVVIKTSPPKARFYRNGKLEGMSPLTVDVPPGEKLKYEVAHECCFTRKLVVDGSETEVTVAMRPSAQPTE